MHCESTSENTHNGVSNGGEREREREGGNAAATSVAIKSRSMTRDARPRLRNSLPLPKSPTSVFLCFFLRADILRLH